MSHRNQHYVPEFLLRQWHSPSDGQLSRYVRVPGALHHRRCSAGSVGWQRDIYSMPTEVGELDSSIERDFMGPYVDDPAAVVLQKIFDAGVTGLNMTEIRIWGQFIVSLLLRVPGTVRELHRRARVVLDQQILQDREPLEEFVGARTLQQFIEDEVPWAYGQLALSTLPSLIQSDKLFAAITNGQWETRTLSKRHPLNLMICDRPLVAIRASDSNFLYALPISPNAIFFSHSGAHMGEVIRKKTDMQLIKGANMSTVTGAERYVVATDQRHGTFIDRHLGRAT